MGIFKKVAKAVGKTAEKGAKLHKKIAKKTPIYRQGVTVGKILSGKAGRNLRASDLIGATIIQDRKGNIVIKPHKPSVRADAMKRRNKVERRQQPKTQLQKLLVPMGGGPKKSTKKTVTRPKSKAKHPGRAYPKPKGKVTPQRRGRRIKTGRMKMAKPPPREYSGARGRARARR